jgi:hypothetical protein
MGYCADIEFSLYFPTQEALDAAIAEAEADSTERGFEAIVDRISEYHDWDNPTDEPLHFVGTGAGKLLWDHEDVLKILADAHVTGIIDGRGEEGSLWRWRFADGEYKDYNGIITYPEDPYDDDLGRVYYGPISERMQCATCDRRVEELTPGHWHHQNDGTPACTPTKDSQ